MEKKYERPMIVQMSHNNTGKHGTNINKFLEVKTDIDGVRIDDLFNKYGSPLFVYSQNNITEKYNRAYKAFSENYPEVQFSWSYKTNYLKSICSLYHKLGSIAEVVSEFEYEKARALGVAGSDIIYNGPDKPDYSIERAIVESALIHIDNFEEIIRINKIAQKCNKEARIGIRVNMNTGMYPQWSRFGLNYENGQVDMAIKKILSLPLLKLEGIHSHIGTFVQDPRSYEIASSKMSDIFNKVLSEYNHKLEYIDLGGGFPSRSHLKGVYQAPEISVKEIEDYAKVITDTLKNKIEKSVLPKLILETGRHLIDESGHLLTKVVTSKVMPDGKRSYVMDAGVNLLYTSSWYNFKIFVSEKVGGLVEPAILNGPLCMNIDVIENNMALPYMKSGLGLTLYPVGAYNITQSMQFIKYRPAVVLIDKEGQPQLIKKRERLETVEFDEVLVENLSL